MRVARSPVDGQLYFSGLTGWQAGATREGSIQRLRHTGETGLYLLQAKARSGRLELEFNTAIDKSSATPSNWKTTAWNYRWSKQYGSPHFKVSEPDVVGTDQWNVSGFELADEGRKLIVGIRDLRPCHTLKLDFSVTGENGTRLTGPLYFTIHELPD